MSKNIKRTLAASLFILCCGIGIGAGIGDTTKVFVGGMIGGMIGAGLAFFILREKIIEEVVEAVNAEPKKGLFDMNEVFETLIEMELEMKLGGASAEVFDRVSDLTDQLYEVLPKMVTRFAANEFTWEISQMAMVHLSNRVGKFLALREEDRTAQEEGFFEDVQRMRRSVLRADEILRKDGINEDEREGLLSELKYGI